MNVFCCNRVLSTIYYLWAVHPFCRKSVLWRQSPILAPCRTVPEQGCITSKVSSVRLPGFQHWAKKSCQTWAVSPQSHSRLSLSHSQTHTEVHVSPKVSHPTIPVPWIMSMTAWCFDLLPVSTHILSIKEGMHNICGVCSSKFALRWKWNK